MTARAAAVTGATGRIGAPLVDALVAAGTRVRALVRSTRPSRPGVEWIVGDLLDPAALARLVDGADVVYHAAGRLDGPWEEVAESLVGGTDLVAQAARGIRLVHLSSLVVLDTARRAGQLDESAPPEPEPERRGAYTRAKSAAEAMLRDRAAQQDIVVVRPGIVVADGDHRIPPAVAVRAGGCLFLVGPSTAALPLVHADDVASGLLLAAGALRSGDVLHLIDPMRVTRAQFCRRLLRDGARGVPVASGAIILAAARVAAWSGRSAVGNLGYRILSAGRRHEWRAERAGELGWRPAALERWMNAPGS